MRRPHPPRPARRVDRQEFVLVSRPCAFRRAVQVWIGPRCFHASTSALSRRARRRTSNARGTGRCATRGTSAPPARTARPRPRASPRARPPRPCRRRCAIAGIRTRRLGAQIGLGLGTVERRAHRVQVVLAAEQHRQLPQRRQVQRLVKRALGHRAVAEEAGGHARSPLHLVGQRQAGGQRQAAADDGIAAEQPGRAVEQVHRAAAAARAAFLLAVHLGHDRASAARAPARGRARGRWRPDCPRRSACSAPPRPPPRRCTDAGSRGSSALRRTTRRSAPPCGGCAPCRPAADGERLSRSYGRVRRRRPRGAAHASRRRTVAMRPPASSVEVSPSGRPSSRALSRRRMILPLRVRGSTWQERDLLRGDGGAQALARVTSSPVAALRRRMAALQATKAFTISPTHRVGLADHAGLGNRRVLHQHALHLERADQVAGRLDHVVAAADEPVVAIGIAPHQIAGEIEIAGKALAVARLWSR
jgi:hypothetical protein